MEEIKEFLIQHDRYDLLAVLTTLLEEIDYSSDSDYEQPEIINEPTEEYLHASLIEEEEYQVSIDENGFHEII